MNHAWRLKTAAVLLALVALGGGCKKSKSQAVVGGVGTPVATGTARDLRLTADGRHATYLLEAEKPRLNGIPPQMLVGELYVAPLDGGAPRKVANGVTNVPGGYLLSSDSRWLLYLAGYNAANQSGELFALKLGEPDAEARKLGSQVTYMLISPDSARVAFVDGGVLRMSGLDRGDPVDIGAEVTTAEFSPDGQWLYFKRKHSAAGGLMAVGVEGGKPIKLADQVGDYVVAPDSKRIAFQQRSLSAPGTFDLFVAEPPSFRPRHVAQASSRFAFTPDSRWLVRTQGASLQAGADAMNFLGDLYVGPAGGGEGSKLGERVQEFLVSPDSQNVAFLDRYNLQLREGRLVVANLEKALPRPLATKVKTLLWSPDGKQLAFQTMVFTEFGPRPDLMLFQLGDEKPSNLLPWVFGFGFSPQGNYLVARSNCTRAGPTGTPRACDLMLKDFSAPAQDAPAKIVEGVFSFKISEDGDRILVTYARMDSDAYDVAVYQRSTQALKTLEQRVLLPAYLVGAEGAKATYIATTPGRAGVHLADVAGAMSASPAVPPQR